MLKYKKMKINPPNPFQMYLKAKKPMKNWRDLPEFNRKPYQEIAF